MKSRGTRRRSRDTPGRRRTRRRNFHSHSHYPHVGRGRDDEAPTLLEQAQSLMGVGDSSSPSILETVGLGTGMGSDTAGDTDSTVAEEVPGVDDADIIGGDADDTELVVGDEEEDEEDEGDEGDDDDDEEGEDEDGDEEGEDEGDEGDDDDGKDTTSTLDTIMSTLGVGGDDAEPEKDDASPDEGDDTTSGVEPTTNTLQNLMNEYEFAEEDICLTKDISQKKASDDEVYDPCVRDGKYIKDLGENHTALVVMYVFPNPVTTGILFSDDSVQLPPETNVPAGYNARIRSQKLWAPFPGTPGVHIRVMCGVVETMTPVKEGENVRLNRPVGITVYSGKLGNIKKHYSGDEIQNASETFIAGDSDTLIDDE